MQRVLLADDEPDILEIARIALENVGGYEVAVCESGTEFLRLLPSFDPDLVIIDALMPDVDGLEFLEAVAKRHASFAVVVTSSPERVSFHAISAIAIHLGARRVMPKPIGLERLRSVLRQSLAA